MDQSDHAAVTIGDVARRAEVSVGTVSRVLNQNPTVRPVTRKAVLAAIAELGYRPNIVARNLRSQRTKTVGLLIGNLTRALAVQAIRGVEIALSASGYAVVIADGRGDTNVEAEALSNLIDRRVDGLLWFPGMPRTAAESFIAEAGIVTVFFGQTSPSPAVPTAMVDENPALDALATHLASLGHRRVGFVGMATARGRLRRLEAALTRAGISPDAHIERLLHPHDDTYAAVQSLVQQANRPSALLAAPHDLVPASIRAVRDLGMRIGSDLSLVGFGDTEWTLAVEPPLSVITVDYVTHARDAASMLLRHIDRDATAPRVIRHQSVYIQRASVGPAIQD